jgi:hypothetical protein
MVAAMVAPDRLLVSRWRGGWGMGLERFRCRRDPIWGVWGGRGSPRKLLHDGTVRSKENCDGSVVWWSGRRCSSSGGGGRAGGSRRRAVNDGMLARPGKWWMMSAASGLTVAWVGLRRARYSEVRGGTHRRLFRLCSRRRRKAAAQWLG